MRLALALLLLLPATATADTVKITQFFDGNGDPELVANTSPNGSPDGYTWSVCRPGESCVEVSHDQVITPGPQPAGTTFKVTASAGEAVSEPWKGAVKAEAPPVLDTAPEVGAPLRVTPGTWSGGWDGDYDDLRIEACRTPAAEDCTTIYAPQYGPFFESNPTTVAERYAGSYLVAASQRLARDLQFPSVGYGAPEVLPPLAPAQTVARSAAAGPITDPYAVPEPGVTLRPSVTLRPRTRRWVGRASCPKRCSLRMVVRSGTLRRVVQRAFTGTRRLSLPRAERRAGRVRVTVFVDGVRLASRRVRVVR